MYNHTSPDYICPICVAVKGIENDTTLIRQSDIVYQDKFITAFISSFFIGKNPGHVIIVPNEHYENIYDLPIEIATRIYATAKDVALALKISHKCDGISTLQNNEPASNQHAFHYHFHVFPRYHDDELFKNMLDKKSSTPEERKVYADKVKDALENIK